MRTWQRAPANTMCGYCPSRQIPRGEMMLLIKLPNVKRERHRCVECAGEAPPDLPPLPELHRSTKKMQPLTRLVFDWKAAQAGREPGEEG